MSHFDTIQLQICIRIQVSIVLFLNEPFDGCKLILNGILLIYSNIILEFLNPASKFIKFGLILIFQLLNFPDPFLVELQITLPFMKFCPFGFLFILHFADQEFSPIQLDVYNLIFVQNEPHPVWTVESDVTYCSCCHHVSIVNVQLYCAFVVEGKYVFIWNNPVTLKYHLFLCVFRLVLAKKDVFDACVIPAGTNVD